MAKTPQHRVALFIVVRTQYEEDSQLFIKPLVLGAYLSIDRAEEIKGKYEQEMRDRGLYDFFEFEVQAATYYDE